MDRYEKTKTKCDGEWYRVTVLLFEKFCCGFSTALWSENDSLGKVLFKGFPEGKKEREEEMHK